MDRAAPIPNDQGMWRLLLARLHPDAGGDHELFVFANAVKEEVCGGGRTRRRPVRRNERIVEHPAVAYLQLWHTLMNPWMYARKPYDE